MVKQLTCDKIDKMNLYKVDILAFGAHPDDVECAMAGTLYKHINLGKKVAIVDLTLGEKGTYGSVIEREKEALNASKILKIHHREQLDLSDGNIENTEKNRLKVIEMIRKYQPQVIFANAIKDFHPDHAKAAQLVKDAAFLSGLKKIETPEFKKWRPTAVYHYIQDEFITPDFVVDVSNEMETKLKSIEAYTSQFVTPKDHNYSGINHLIRQIKNINGLLGRPINVKYAEGFTTNKYLGVDNILELK